MGSLKIAALAALIVTGTAMQAQAGATFDAVKNKGFIQCGVNLGLPGFSAPDPQGNWAGIDVDVCRAAAAALFGDATKVKYTPLSAQQRLTALQSGEVDVLSRNTTWSMSRDTANGLNFTATNYYDGQGFMVTKKAGVNSAKNLDGATVCVLTGTTSELNLADFFRTNNLKFTPITIEKNEEMASAFLAGRCDAISSDVSQLASIRANETPNPDDYVILPEVVSKEPLAPAVRHGDDQWFDLVKWSFYAMVAAEEKGITSANIDSFANSQDPDVKRMLGITPGLGQGMGVSDKWAYNIIKQVGNYGESFSRNIGDKSKLKLERGLNNQWTKGGLMYAPPIR